ncbi:hypothetical protein WH52_03770 [Tenacibaculum holothuriorum]|uniref:BatD protein n=1 Tax=Tenacibaculum holothuriorum TaxID=1635173 RepID=A0A1Y2PEC8_9FLAO|nr:hypothetical protein [Tenacibaculum holothuriorum]OSY88795.1 hypothetical protein WH52_03770 [Tenacibaculum holothuriorum]
MKQRLLYFFLLLSAISFAQNSLVKAELDTTNIRIGEQFQLKISVNETQNVIIPKLEGLQGLEVIDTLKTDTLKNKLVKKFILTGFDSGAFYIPQQQIFVKNQAYLTDSLLVNVATVAIDTTKVKKFPIKGIKGEPYQFDDFKSYIYWAIGILVLIAALLYFFVFKKKKETEEIIVEPALPPYEEAMSKFKELDKKLLWQNNKVKKYYSELTGIIRHYIERELSVPALESTTDELMETLNDLEETSSIETNKETLKRLKALLQEADLVKFAKSKPLSHEIEEDRKDAEQVVNNLKPKQIVEENAE